MPTPEIDFLSLDELQLHVRRNLQRISVRHDQRRVFADCKRSDVCIEVEESCCTEGYSLQFSCPGPRRLSSSSTHVIKIPEIAKNFGDRSNELSDCSEQSDSLKSHYLSIHELLPVAKFGRTTVNGKILGAAFNHEESLKAAIVQSTAAVSVTFHVLSVMIFWIDPSASSNSQ